MPEQLGQNFLYFATILALYGFVMSLVGARTGRPRLIESARNALFATAGLTALSTVLLEVCLLTGRFHVEYVHQHTSAAMPTAFKVAALWAGQNGSLLFWVLVLAGYAVAVNIAHGRRNLDLMPYVNAVMSGAAFFFLTVLVLRANPFQTVPFEVLDGRGLNPLLRNHYMITHPPTLYLGYVGMTVPYAFAIAALISGRLGNEWVYAVRRWTLIAWFFLTLGNLLGASWAYEVLGWGGYWGWDPVENASFIPWLTATAFLHSVIIQEKRGMLKTWNMVLVILTFLFTVLGTFMTRSGIVSSVHSFAQSDIGGDFLIFLGVATAASVALLVFRRKELRSRGELDSLLSREATFLFNNVVLVVAALAVLWGTLFPVISEIVRGVRITVGPGYFNRLMVPLGLLLLLLTGVGPLTAWRRTSGDQLRKSFMHPSLLAVAAGLSAYAYAKSAWAAAALGLSAFVLATIVSEFGRGAALRMRTFGEGPFSALLKLITANRRRYGGYIVHAGVVFLYVGFAGNAFKEEAEVRLRPGEAARLGAYDFRFLDFRAEEDSRSQTLYADLSVERNGLSVATLRPARVLHMDSSPHEKPQDSTVIAIDRSMRKDLYAAFLGFQGENTAGFKIFINPLVAFVWLGGLIVMLGTALTLWPSASRRQGGPA